MTTRRTHAASRTLSTIAGLTIIGLDSPVTAQESSKAPGYRVFQNGGGYEVAIANEVFAHLATQDSALQLAERINTQYPKFRAWFEARSKAAGGKYFGFDPSSDPKWVGKVGIMVNAAQTADATGEGDNEAGDSDNIGSLLASIMGSDAGDNDDSDESDL